MDPNINMNIGEIETIKNSHKQIQTNDIEKIDVEDLIKDFKILNVNSLAAYFKELWKVRKPI